MPYKELFITMYNVQNTLNIPIINVYYVGLKIY